MVQTQISKALVTATSMTSYETNEIDYEFLCQGFFFFLLLILFFFFGEPQLYGFFGASSADISVLFT